MRDPVVAAIIHFQTPDLITRAAESFRAIYPEVPLWLVDNGSEDGSDAVVSGLADRLGVRTRFRGLPGNIFHGPAMDLVLREAESEFVFFLDSDTITRRAGFLESMQASMAAHPEALAVGSIVTVNRRGFAAPAGIPVPESAYMLIRRSVYQSLPPFVHHGLPVLACCKEAQRRGNALLDYPIAEHVDHLGRGTAERFGYGLGWRSRLDYVLHRLGW